MNFQWMRLLWTVIAVFVIALLVAGGLLWMGVTGSFWTPFWFIFIIGAVLAFLWEVFTARRATVGAGGGGGAGAGATMGRLANSPLVRLLVIAIVVAVFWFGFKTGLPSIYRRAMLEQKSFDVRTGKNVPTGTEAEQIDASTLTELEAKAVETKQNRLDCILARMDVQNHPGDPDVQAQVTEVCVAGNTSGLSFDAAMKEKTVIDKEYLSQFEKVRAGRKVFVTETNSMDASFYDQAIASLENDRRAEVQAFVSIYTTDFGKPDASGVTIDDAWLDKHKTEVDTKYQPRINKLGQLRSQISAPALTAASPASSFGSIASAWSRINWRSWQPWAVIALVLLVLLLLFRRGAVTSIFAGASARTIIALLAALFVVWFLVFKAGLPTFPPFHGMGLITVWVVAIIIATGVYMFITKWDFKPLVLALVAAIVIGWAFSPWQSVHGQSVNQSTQIVAAAPAAPRVKPRHVVRRKRVILSKEDCVCPKP